MKQVLLFAVLFTALSGAAQTENKDSVHYFQRQLWLLRRASDSALRASAAYREALEGVRRQSGRNPKAESYSAFVIFGGYVHNDFSELNASLATTGYPALRADAWQGGFGFSSKNGPAVFDLYFVTTSGVKSAHGDEKVHADLNNFLQFDLGFDLIPGKRIALYPFAGLSLRNSTIRYSRGTEYNPTYVNITNLVASQPSTKAVSTRVGYQAGIGLDVLLGENKDHTTNKILFIKAGLNRPVWADRYRVEGNELASVRQGLLACAFGIKFGEWNR